jgi:hypothetical protein
MVLAFGDILVIIAIGCTCDLVYDTVMELVSIFS